MTKKDDAAGIPYSYSSEKNSHRINRLSVQNAVEAEIKRIVFRWQKIISAFAEAATRPPAKEQGRTGRQACKLV